ncbi:MAG: prepilin-type N-terminal cleavage/methylation domain-containing protein [Bryobacter sp.]|jgi:type II secretory pathway pseudopilin PulG|nr:prepilin-type N-terminal cleavage/methylation domain-containing protein [Bryobacter sp. CoA8 C33]
MRRRGAESGVTLLEMLLVVGVIGLMAAISFPSFSAGLDGLRLRSASTTVASALNVAINTADRRQAPVQVLIQPLENRIVLRAAESRRDQFFTIPPGIRIRRILPALYLDEAKKDRYLIVYPNGAPPQLIVELETQRGSMRQVKLDPITGAARVMDVNVNANANTKK